MSSDATQAAMPRRTLDLRASLRQKNEELAKVNRRCFAERGLLVVNFLSSPGSGKTALLEATIRAASSRKIGVLVGDLATDNDAQRISAAGARTLQINTGTVCHLDATMIDRAASELGLDELDWLFIENVGNLVCPAGYDLGENMRVVLLSTTEGEDKPLKYPVMYRSADVVLVTKVDLGIATGYDREKALNNIQQVSPKARILELSAKDGQGMEAWLRLLEASDSYAASRWPATSLQIDARPNDSFAGN